MPQVSNLIWHQMHKYPTEEHALFWVDDGVSEYCVYGYLPEVDEGPRTIWDDNDFGYADEGSIVAFAFIGKPPSKFN